MIYFTYMHTKKVLLFVLVILLIGAGYFVLRNTTPQPSVIGGDRDSHGCLGPAGYAWSEDVGACIRSFELTPDIMRAAKIAVDNVGREYALTVVSFNSYEEVGSYDITFEHGVDRQKETVVIKNWQVNK